MVVRQKLGRIASAHDNIVEIPSCPAWNVILSV